MSITKRIVIADDHPIFLKGLAEVIQQEEGNSVVDVAHDGDEAIQLTRLLRPHLVVLDIEMPGINGLETARLIHQEFPEIKLIILTMHNNPAALDLAMANNVMGYVLKENAVTDVCECIREVWEDRHYVSPQMRDSLQGRNLDDKKLSDLTTTELTILRKIASNMTSRAIAEELFISEKTVSNHRQNIATKLGLHGSHMLLRYALENQRILTTMLG